MRMRKVVIVLLLSVALEVTGFVAGLGPFRGTNRTGPAGRPGQEVNPVKTGVEKPREGLKADQVSPTGASSAETSPNEGDPSRNPFALPAGVHPLSGAAPSLRPPGEVGAHDTDPARAAVPEPPARELSGILVGPRDRVAIIDGTLLRAGDSVEGEHVIDIPRDHVVLARDGQRRTLRLPPPFPGSGQRAGQPETRASADGVQPKRSNGAKP